MAEENIGVVRPKQAATVMLVRDASAGEAPSDHHSATQPPRMQVLMLRRNDASTWAGGISLFPGGAVDEADRGDEIARFCRGYDDAGASRVLGLETGGLAHFVAALRECFEEAGVLVASKDGRPLSEHGAEVVDRFAEHRHRLNGGLTTLAAICAAEDLTLEVDRLRYFSHWITPQGSARRYDTRFFVACVPGDQPALHDDEEVVDSLWIEPSEALQRGARGEIQLWLPTMKNLEALASFGSAAELFAAPAQSAVPTVRPRMSNDGEVARILLPGDAGYDEAAGPAPE